MIYGTMYLPNMFEILFHERNNTMKQAKKTRNTAALLALLMLGASCIASCGDAQTENQPVVTEAVKSRSWIGLVMIAGVLTFLLAGAMIFRSVSGKNRY